MSREASTLKRGRPLDDRSKTKGNSVRDTAGGTTGPYLRPEISKRGFEYPREYVCVYAYEGEASPSLFVGRVRVISKGSARGRGSNWSRIRSKPNFSTRARGPSTVPVSGSQ